MTLPLPAPSISDFTGIQQNFDAIAQQFPINVKNIASAEALHVIGATGEPGFQNSWTHFAGGYRSVSFYRDPFGVVRLAGMAKSGTVGTAIFTLPAGYRPSGLTLWPTISNGVFAYVQIDTAGVVLSNGSNVYVSLDVVSFRV